MRIYAATKDDLDTLYELDHIARDDPGRRDFIRNAVHECRVWCVATNETETIGYGVITHVFFGRSFIEMVYIKEQYRSKGYGPELIQYLQAQSQSKDIFTSTNESNAHMQHVLLRLGYQQSGIIYNLEPDDPELVFVKQLDQNNR